MHTLLKSKWVEVSWRGILQHVFHHRFILEKDTGNEGDMNMSYVRDVSDKDS